MKSRKNFQVVLLITSFVFFIFISCSQEKNNWEKAKTINSLNAYLEYLEKYPDSKYAIEAEELAWKFVREDGTSQAYNSYLKSMKAPSHESEAKIALSELVLIPYMGFVGDSSEMPAIDSLKVPEHYFLEPAIRRLSDEPDEIIAIAMSSLTPQTKEAQTLNNLSFEIEVAASTIFINGKEILLENVNEGYVQIGEEIEIKTFGKLRCKIAQIVSKSDPSLILYLGGTPKQRDEILAFLRNPQK